MRLAVVLCFFCLNVYAQVNKTANFSFEVEGGSPSLAARWIPAWNGYQRVVMPAGQNWDGSFALRLDGPPNAPLGAVQRITFNQTSHVPILITMQIKGDRIGDSAADKLGASFDCRVKFTTLPESQLSFCPTTHKTKNTGTFDWRYVGVNTTDLVNGHLPIEWLEVRLRRGEVEGTAWFDDVQVKEFPPGTFQGAVTLMFDDGYKEHLSKALPAMGVYGWKGVLAAVSEYVVSGDPEYCNLKEIQHIQNSGWEIVSHSVNHPALTFLSPVEAEDQLYWSRRYFLENGVRVKSFALPFGDYNASVLGLNEERGYYSSMRNSDSGFNPMGTFPHSVKVQKVESDTSISQIRSWLSAAKARKAWLILLFHKIRPACNDRYCVSDETFSGILNAVQNAGLPVVTYEKGLQLVKSPVN
jgi:peptidoglycan/xylan/chitin deacetylase (PgdA/CDA1 family)